MNAFRKRILHLHDVRSIPFFLGQIGNFYLYIFLVHKFYFLRSILFMKRFICVYELHMIFQVYFLVIFEVAKLAAKQMLFMNTGYVPFKI